MEEFDFSIDGMTKMQLHNPDKISVWLMQETIRVKTSVINNLIKDPINGKKLIHNFSFLVRKHVFITDKPIFLKKWNFVNVAEMLARASKLIDASLADELNYRVFEICSKANEELLEAYQDQRIDPTKKYIEPIKPTKEFYTFLNSSNEILLAEKLKELFSGKKGKDIAIMIIALEKLDKIRYTNRTELYDSIRQKFGDIGANSGINDYLTPFKTNIATNRKPILTEVDIRPFITKINSLGC